MSVVFGFELNVENERNCIVSEDVCCIVNVVIIQWENNKTVQWTF